MREEIAFQYLGWQTAHLMNCHVGKKGKRVTVRKLCGKPKYIPDSDRPSQGKAQTAGAEHEKIKGYFKNARRRRSQSSARA